jgi:hypothetical protein
MKVIERATPKIRKVRVRKKEIAKGVEKKWNAQGADTKAAKERVGSANFWDSMLLSANETLQKTN